MISDVMVTSPPEGAKIATKIRRMDRIKTTLRLPKYLHERFDDSNMNAEIVERLEQSFLNEWRGRSMSAKKLLNELALPDVVRLKKNSGNPHDEMSRVCELISGLPVDAILIGCNRAKQLIAIIQLPDTTILADNLSFSLDSQGRAHDLQRLVGCLDAHGHLKSVRALLQPAKETHNLQPNQALDSIARNLGDDTGITALRSLFKLMNTGIEVDV